ncbi:hypothetical protein MSG28_015581 [Choristoneura fumiferana]|uniref:Uncharacterized protein n=1 Tax=Choristoneura fumiferana TaxID=7141 RepID=A0ACC0KB74_CHOFU|nr:hypothetical protein MSG28_015581 [Choristoneura fumiferana]
MVLFIREGIRACGSPNGEQSPSPMDTHNTEPEAAPHYARAAAMMLFDVSRSPARKLRTLSKLTVINNKTGKVPFTDYVTKAHHFLVSLIVVDQAQQAHNAGRAWRKTLGVEIKLRHVSQRPKNKKKRTAFQLEIPTAPKKRGSVFTCGQGDVGQLGLGEDVTETTKFKYVAGLGDKIVDVCSGGMHTIALDSDGKVWTFGCNDEGALGRPTSGEAEEGTAGAVKLPAKAVAVSAGDSHSAALLEDGQVYAWGAFRDSHGSMGLIVRGREGKACREPVRIDVGETAAAVASGGDHLVILSTSGGVYTMGCGEQGQLGRLSQRSASRDARQGFSALLAPSKVTLKWAASHVWAGYHATFALDGSTDKMFAWGLNNYGQLGITGEKRKTALYSPTECDAFSGESEAEGGGAAACAWRGVAPAQHHSLALSATGQVFAVGRCEYGRLGLGDREGDAEALEPVPALAAKKCVSIATGTCNSFAVTDTGEVLAWGMGSEGQLGTGAAKDANTPQAVVPAALHGKRPAKVAAGAQHTVLLAIDTSPSKEKSPTPEMETEEQPAEEKVEKKDEKKEKPKGRQTKRLKRDEQEDEVSSTSSAQPSEEDKLAKRKRMDQPSTSSASTSRKHRKL